MILVVTSNSTPLIYLAKVNRLDILRRLFNIIQIPDEVRLECVDAGKRENHPDAYLIDKFIQQKMITVHTLPKNVIVRAELIAEEFGIDVGEAQAILLAKNKNEDEILADESHTRKAAKSLGLRPRGTIYVILTAAQRGIVSKDEGIDLLNKMVRSNFHVSVTIYQQTIRALQELK